MGDATISGHTFPAARLSEPETRFFEHLIAAGVSVQRVEPFDRSRSVYANAVIHRVVATPSLSFVEATSLVLPFEGTTCSHLAQPGYRYRIVLAGFSQGLSDSRPIRFLSFSRQGSGPHRFETHAAARLRARL